MSSFHGVGSTVYRGVRDWNRKCSVQRWIGISYSFSRYQTIHLLTSVCYSVSLMLSLKDLN